MITRKLTLTALGAALMLSAAAPIAMAAPRGCPDRHGPPMRPELAYVYLLKTADANKDGKITKEEFAARQDAIFTEIDANKDGKLDETERAAAKTAGEDLSALMGGRGPGGRGKGGPEGKPEGKDTPPPAPPGQ